MYLGAIAWFIVTTTLARQERRHRGHHPHLSVDYDLSVCRLSTSNRTLVDDLLARNPAARLVSSPEPPASFPGARIVKE